MDDAFKSVRGKRDHERWGVRRKSGILRGAAVEYEARKSEGEMFRALEERAKKEQIMYGWLGKLKSGADPEVLSPPFLSPWSCQ
eukprot:2037865-Rhodomonas_salina.4